MRRELYALALAALACSVQAQIRFTTYVTGLSQPVAMVQDPSQTNVQYVVQKTGLIRVIQNGALLPTPFVDMSSMITTASEEGLLGLAFPSDYGSSGFAYLFYTDTSGNIQISRYTRASSNPLTLNTATAYKIISQAHPNYQNHNGGTLKFGPDGYLYAGIGDGGSEYDPNQNGQNPNTLLSKIIRIDPRSDDFPNDPNRNYHIPIDNPFVGGNPIAAMGEIWDFGVRNPWKWSFDTPSLGGTGALIIGDVGQDTYEEIDFEQPGTGGYNYGWRLMEGFHVTGLGGNQAYAPLTNPVYEYTHFGSVGNDIMGGYVYRGSNLGTFWNGRYFFADESTGDIWSLNLNQSGTGSVSDVIRHSDELGSVGNVDSIDIDATGELYFVSYNQGAIYKIVPATVFPTALTVYRGVIASGGLSDLLQVDGKRLAVNFGPTLNTSESPVTLRLDATAPTQTAASLRFFIDAQASTPGLTQVVELWDYTANAWVQIDSRPASWRVDKRNVLLVSNPNNFIQSGTLAMRAQVRYFQSGPTLTFPWQARVNQTVWGFYP